MKTRGSLISYMKFASNCLSVLLACLAGSGATVRLRHTMFQVGDAVFGWPTRVLLTRSDSEEILEYFKNCENIQLSSSYIMVVWSG